MLRAARRALRPVARRERLRRHAARTWSSCCSSAASRARTRARSACSSTTTRSSPKQKTPFIVRKSDGAFLYSTTDIATCSSAATSSATERAIYVVDQRAEAALPAAVRQCASSACTMELEHVGFGSVLGKDGKPLKTARRRRDQAGRAARRGRGARRQADPRRGARDRRRRAMPRARARGRHRRGEVRRPVAEPAQRLPVRLGQDDLVQGQRRARTCSTPTRAICGDLPQGRDRSRRALAGGEPAALEHEAEIALGKQLAALRRRGARGRRPALPHLSASTCTRSRARSARSTSSARCSRPRAEQRRTRLLLCWLTARQLAPRPRPARHRGARAHVAQDAREHHEARRPHRPPPHREPAARAATRSAIRTSASSTCTCRPATTSGARRYPLVMALAGYGSTHQSFLNFDFFQPNPVERFDRLIREGRMPPALLVLPDAINRWGGSQFIDSRRDRPVPELPGRRDRAVRRSRATAPCPRARGARCGQEQRRLRRAAAWASIGRRCSARSAATPATARSRPASCPSSRAPRSRTTARAALLGLHRALRTGPRAGRLHRVDAARLCRRVCARTRSRAPVLRAADRSAQRRAAQRGVRSASSRTTRCNAWQRDAHALRSATLVYLDAGDRDEHGLQFGARRLAALLVVALGHVHHEEFSGGHRGTAHRYETVLAAADFRLRKRNRRLITLPISGGLERPSLCYLRPQHPAVRFWGAPATDCHAGLMSTNKSTSNGTIAGRSSQRPAPARRGATGRARRSSAAPTSRR